MGSESEDDEFDNSEDVEPTTESAVAWLSGLPKDQKIVGEGKTYNILLLHAPLLIPVLQLLGLKACYISASNAQGRGGSLMG